MLEYPQLADDCEARLYAQLTSAHRTFSLEELNNFPGGGHALEPSLDALVAQGRAIRLDGDAVLSDVAWGRLETTSRRVVAAYHKKHPFVLGMPVADLALGLPKAAEFTAIEPIVVRLVEIGVVARESRNRVRLASHAVVMPEGWQAAASEMLEVYAAAGLQPPSSYNFQANYPRHINVRTILGILAETNVLVQLEAEIYIDAATYGRVKDTVRKIAGGDGGEITVGAVRDALGSTRKFVLPLLELLDAEGITRREGDVHFLVG